MDDLKARIRAVPNEYYPEIWNALNVWTWPPLLGEAPAGWDDMSHEAKSKAVVSVMRSIEISVGKKALLRYYHTHNLGETDLAFDDWWDSRELIEELLNKTDNLSEVPYEQPEHKRDKRHQYLYCAIDALIMFLLGLLIGYFLILF